MAKKNKFKNFDSESEYKDEIKNNISRLEDNIQNILDEIDEPIDSLFPSDDLLPGLDMEINLHDYEKDIQLVKIAASETITCLANLYLDEETMKNKNINSIIKDDASKLSELNFNVTQSKRALIMCMKQLDLGVNDPEMFQSVTMFQKEMRDTIKMTYDLQIKMKDFYKNLKGELDELNKGEDLEDNLGVSMNIIGDPKELNKIIDAMIDDPTLLDYNTKKEREEKEENEKKNKL
jgi:hypothetical protein